ncbi:DUF563 domain-containing protein [Colletotrichum melonis]|uniref:EGF domain-specific O-linked N-acetylglucosamine transferase n=1 Tax=Colletotrichum melonis TaxID=1209925 RepID=A0AAI9XVK7_9PEZI|nr:DUF563 domain-containing protein [Colletotrichum melonis]
MPGIKYQPNNFRRSASYGFSVCLLTMRSRLLPKSKRAGAAALLMMILLHFLVSSSQSTQTGERLSFLHNPFHPTPRPPKQEVPISLPELVTLSKPDLPESEFCAKRFGPRYLNELRDQRIQYCSAESSANLTCFHSHTQSNDNRDSFCIGQGAVLDRESGKFHVDCDVRQPTGNETANGIISFSNIRNYWYDTGPGFLFQNFVKVQAGASPSSVTQAPTHHGSRPFTILVKREGHSNIWHSLMEIWSMVMSLDVLRLSHDGNDLNKPFFTIPGDVPRTQVVFLDNQEEGPLYPLWGMFAGREPLRLSKVLEDPVQAQALAETPQNLIIPLAGGSNPLWQNDWEDRDCKDAPLLKVFTRRVMQQFGVEFETGRRQGKPLNITLIDRRGSRKLLDQEVLLDGARKAFPDANFQAIDLGAVTFPEQLRIVQSTDILVGVHGAGLTHTMFLRENGAAVVEIQPSSMSHKGFRNVAQMLGHKYFSTHAEMVGHEEDDKGRKRGLIRRDRWHWADIRIEEGAFLELIGQAVEAMRE